MSALCKEEEIDKIKQLIVVMNLISSDSMPIEEWYDFVDAVEAQILQYEQVEFKMEHILLNGIYIRRAYMPEGTFAVTRIHNTEHPFVILKGSMLVRSHLGKDIYRAPYRGITTPGTRRVLTMLEDVIMETYHPTNLNSVTEIVETLYNSRRNPLLTDEQILELNNYCQRTNSFN